MPINVRNLSQNYFKTLRKVIAFVIEHNEKKIGNLVFVFWGAFLSIFLLFDQLYFNYVEGLSSSTYDFLVSHKYNKKVSDKLLIVDIDEASIAQLSSTTGGWPWSRDVYTVVFDYLTAIGAKGVVLDLLITDPSRCDKDGDRNFSAFLSGSSNIFLPYSMLQSTDASKINLPINYLHPECVNKEAKITATYPFVEPFLKKGQVGFDNLFPDEDGVVRSYKSKIEINSCELESLASISLKKTDYTSKAENEFLINWRQYSDFTTISFSDLFTYATQMNTSSIPTKLFKDKVIFIGTTTGLGSSSKTPLSNTTPGLYIQANAFENMISGDTIKKLPQWFSVGVALLFIIILTTIYYVEYYIFKLERIIAGINIAALILFALVLNFFNYYVDLIYGVTYAFIYLGFASLYGDLKSRYIKGRYHFKDELKGNTSYDFHMLLVRFRGISKKEKNKIVNSLQEICLKMKSEPSVVEDWMSKGTLMGKEFSDSFIIYWLFDVTIFEKKEYLVTKDTDSIIALLKTIQKETNLPLVYSNAQSGKVLIHDRELDFDKVFYQTFAQAFNDIANKMKK